MQRLEYSSEQTRKIGGWEGTELASTTPAPWHSKSFQLYQLKRMLTAEEATEILEIARSHPSYEMELDTVDEMPTFEYYPLRDGTWEDQQMQQALEHIIQDRILPYMREQFDCPACMVGDVLVRRYVPGERRTHALHFDSHAFATAVLGLSDPDDYEGGLFVQPGPHASSRRFPFIDVGDLLVHSFELQHGVHVRSGLRHSLIFWLKDSPEAVASDATPWVDQRAATGDPHGLHLKGCDAFKVHDMRQALGLYKRSARAGHPWSEYFLGVVYSQMAQSANTTPVQQLYNAQAMKWWTRAADAGLVEAQKDLAVTYMSGEVVDEDPVQAAWWLEEAAKQLDLQATHAMGEMYRDGTVFGIDKAKARSWLQRSADAGYQPSVKALRRLSSQAARRLLRKRLLKKQQQQQKQQHQQTPAAALAAAAVNDHVWKHGTGWLKRRT